MGRPKKTDEAILEELLDKLITVERDQEALYKNMKVLQQRIRYFLKRCYGPTWKRMLDMEMSKSSGRAFLFISSLLKRLLLWQRLM